MYEDYLVTYQEYIKLAGGDESRVLANIQDSGRLKYGRCLSPIMGNTNKHPNILWGGDSTKLSTIAYNHGYKVLWASDYLVSSLPGDEIVIVDDTIFDNGLYIIDDCSAMQYPRLRSK